MYQIYIKHTKYAVEKPWVILDTPYETLDAAKISARHYDTVFRQPVKIVNTETQEEYTNIYC